MPLIARSKKAYIPAVEIVTAEPSSRQDFSSTPSQDASNFTLDPNFHFHPPKFTIDLSLPPAERYVKLATEFKSVLFDVKGLFDDVVRLLYPRFPIGSVQPLARLILRKLSSPEETEELRGISKAAGIEMYLLIALNTLLDTMMGCTSGGVRTKKTAGADTKMLHFRTLDWGMDALRRLVVQLEFIRSPGGEIVARSITYAGYTGVLTGVRKDLSLSLNFRPNHNAQTLRSQYRFYLSQLLVLLGRRPSISSLLRKNLLAPEALSLDAVTSAFPSIPSTAAYLIFSDGDSTVVLEKDHNTALIRRRKDFMVVTNHDRMDESQEAAHENAHHSSASPGIGEEFLSESVTRKLCLRQKWRDAVLRAVSIDPGEHDAPDGMDEDLGISVQEDSVVEWLQAWPIINECTHYAVVMDPKEGEFTWFQWIREPVTNSETNGDSEDYDSEYSLS